jgi:hypothetical protein
MAKTIPASPGGVTREYEYGASSICRVCDRGAKYELEISHGKEHVTLS